MNDAMVRASTHLFEHVGNNPIPQGLEAKNEHVFLILRQTQVNCHLMPS